MKSFCVFCKTGLEVSVAKKINILEKSVTAIAPMRTIQQRLKGKWIKKETVLLPGYVFLYSEEEFDTGVLYGITDLYKVLSYETGVRALTGKDHDYAMWIMRHQGCITPSKVLVEGGNVKVIDGPLLDACGVIKKIDRHKRKAWVEFEFDGTVKNIVLSAESIDNMEKSG